MSIGRMIEKAQHLGMDTLAITDHNALYGGVQFYHQAMKQGIKPILGAEVTIEGGNHLTLLAKDWKGYGNLCRIISEAHLNSKEKKPVVSLDTLVQCTQGLIALSGCRKGELSSLLLQDRTERGTEIIQRYRDMFGPKNLYIELQWTDERRQQKLIRQLLALAKKLHLPVVATNNVHFLTPEDHAIHRTLTSIRKQTTVSNITPDSIASPDFYFKSESEMRTAFSEIPEALTNTQEITERCNVKLPTGKPIFPRFDLPTEEKAGPYLRNLALRGLKKRYGVLSRELTERLYYELTIINAKGFTEYFLIVWDIVQYAHSRGIPAVGRGSAANSLVSYVLGLTDADPMRYHLTFERFLNPSRSDPPDIDIDFCWRSRDDVLDYVYKKYGHDRVAMICTYATLRLRSAFREVAKVFGLPLLEINRLSKRLPSFGISNLNDALDSIPECRDIPIDQEPYRTIFRISQAISGFPRHLGIHCGGIVIGREPLNTWTPLEMATKGIVVTQYDMHSIEALGLVKIDLLGQRALTIVAETVNTVEDRHGTRVDMNRIPENDPKTADLIRHGLTLGCFQIESPGMRHLLQQMEAETPEDVIVGLSLIRPGPAESGMKEQYVRYRRGLDKVTYLHPKLKEVLGDTYGIMLYQEDIMKVASAVAGLSLAEADGLRRAVTKKRSRQEMAKNQQTFMSGAHRKGVPNDIAEKIWRRMANFAAYSFCKSHAATYGQIAYQCCYLKVHHPVEFLTAVLNNQAGYYPTSAYIEEARRLGIDILPPDINRSREEYSAEEEAIRIGLTQVKDLETSVIQSILIEREQTPFANLYDFCWRVEISQGEVENLIKCGAMDGFGKTKPELLWELNLMYTGIVEEKKKYPDAELFSLPETFRMPAEVPRISDYTVEQKIRFEQEILGFVVHQHPLTLYQDILSGEYIIPSHRLNEFSNQKVNLAGRYVISRRTKTSKDEFMKFLTLEDLHGTFEVVLFPETYKKYGMQLVSKGPFIVHGTVKLQYGSVALVCNKIQTLSLTSKHSSQK